MASTILASARLRRGARAAVLFFVLAFVSVSARAGNTTYTYDELGRAVSTAVPTAGVTYTYDNAGNRIQQSVTCTTSCGAPVANADTAFTPYNTPVTVNVLANDSDPNSYTLSITSVGTPSHGTASISGASVIYTPTSGYFGADSFTYAMSNGHGGTGTANVSITVASNAPPVANPVAATVVFNTPLTINVLFNDSDPNNYPLTISSVTTPSHGSAVISGTNVVYTPTTSYIGPDSFSYTISNGHGGTASAPVSLTVSPPAPPVAGLVTAMTAGLPSNINVLAGATSSLGYYPLTISSVGVPAHGSATFSGSLVTYTPMTGYSGPDSFTYTITDSHGGASTSTVTVTNVIADGALMFYGAYSAGVSSYSFTVPSTAPGSLTITLYGGGGGGRLHGGGGSGYAQKYMLVTPGTTVLSGLVGANGTGDCGTGCPPTSGTTSFLTSPAIYAYGGGAATSAAGTAGTASGGDTNITGEAGDTGATGNGGANLGPGGGARQTTVGANGNAPGGGGAGQSAVFGGDGGSGTVSIVAHVGVWGSAVWGTSVW